MPAGRGLGWREGGLVRAGRARDDHDRDHRHGVAFWYLPEQAVDGVPWFGIASDEGAIGGIPLDVFGPTLTLSLAVEAPAGGQFSVWGTVDDAEHPPFKFSTATGLTQTTVITASHSHLSWAFTVPGEYLVEARTSGTVVATGAQMTSAPVVYRFVVEP